MRLRDVAIGFAMIVAAGSAKAAVVYDTISNETETGRLLLLVQQNHAPLGDAFSTAVTETLSSVSVQLIDPVASTHVTDTGSVLVYLVPDVGGLPSHTNATLTGTTFLGSIADSSLLGNSVVNNETLTTNVTLAPGNYWIELTSGSDPNNFEGTINSTPSTAGWAEITNAAAAGALGLPGSLPFSSYQSPTANTGLVDASDGYVFMMQLQTTVPAPEPTSLALLGAGLMGLGVGRHRFKKQAG